MSIGVFFGLAGLDSVYYIDHLPFENDKIRTNEYRSFIGGPAANAAITYSLLGGEAILITYLGDSFISMSIKEELNKLYGIKVYDCSHSKNELPPMSSIAVNNKNASRTILSGQPNKFNMKFTKNLHEIYKKADFFFTDSNLPEITLPIIKEIQKYNKAIVLDLGSWKDNSLEFILLSDEIIASEKCRHKENGEDFFTLKENINKSNIAITDGENKIIFLEDGHIDFIKPPTVIAKDTLAAGDIFHGAYCFYRFVKQNNFRNSLEYASVIASESVQYIGPREGIYRFIE